MVEQKVSWASIPGSFLVFWVVWTSRGFARNGTGGLLGWIILVYLDFIGVFKLRWCVAMKLVCLDY